MRDKKKQSLYGKQYRSRPEVKARIIEYRKIYYSDPKNRTKALLYGRNYKREKATGCTPEKYLELYEKQNGLCAICSAVSLKELHVDHNHATGIIRGLLCGKCNTGIGLLQDNPNILLKAIHYLQGESK